MSNSRPAASTASSVRSSRVYAVTRCSSTSASSCNFNASVKQRTA